MKFRILENMLKVKCMSGEEAPKPVGCRVLEGNMLPFH